VGKQETRDKIAVEGESKHEDRVSQKVRWSRLGTSISVWFKICMVFVSCTRILILDAIVGTVFNGIGSVAHESKELQAEGSYR
jgi:hypothetical protein